MTVDLPRFHGRLVLGVDSVCCGFFPRPVWGGEGRRATPMKRAGRRSPEGSGRPGVARSFQAAWLSFSKFTGDA